MKPPSFSYFRPRSLDSALEMLARDEDAKIIAGGQTLVPLLNFRFARPDVLIDITGIDGLNTIKLYHDHLAVGATARQRDLELDPAVVDAFPLIGQALRHVGHIQTRARGTVGGSIANAHPVAELPAVVIALDADIVIRGPRGERSVAAEDFFLGPLMTVLEMDEIVTQIRIPNRGWNRTAFNEIVRRHGDFAIVGIAVSARLSETKRVVEDIRIVGMGVAPIPVRLKHAEAAVLGMPLGEAQITAACEAAVANANPVEDHKGDVEYRRRILRVLLAKTLREVAEK